MVAMNLRHLQQALLNLSLRWTLCSRVRWSTSRMEEGRGSLPSRPSHKPNNAFLSFARLHQRHTLFASSCSSVQPCWDVDGVAWMLSGFHAAPL